MPKIISHSFYGGYETVGLIQTLFAKNGFSAPKGLVIRQPRAAFITDADGEEANPFCEVRYTEEDDISEILRMIEILRQIGDVEVVKLESFHEMVPTKDAET